MGIHAAVTKHVSILKIFWDFNKQEVQLHFFKSLQFVQLAEVFFFIIIKILRQTAFTTLESDTLHRLKQTYLEWGYYPTMSLMTQVYHQWQDEVPRVNHHLVNLSFWSLFIGNWFHKELLGNSSYHSIFLNRISDTGMKNMIKSFARCFSWDLTQQLLFITKSYKMPLC